MKRHMLVAAALLFLANGAKADYLLIKIDFDQIDWASLRSGEPGKFDPGKFQPGKFEPGKGPRPKGGSADGARESSGNNVIYGVFEYRYDAKQKELHYIETEISDAVNDPKKGSNPKPAPIDIKNPKGKGTLPPPPPPDTKKPPVSPDKKSGATLMARVELDLPAAADHPARKLIFPMIPGMIEKKENIIWGGGLVRRTLKEEFDQMDKSAKSERELLELAFWALKRNLMKEFRDTMEKLGRDNQENTAFKRFALVRDAIKQKPAEPQMSEALRAELKGYDSLNSDHYTIYFKDKIDSSHIKRRLDRFESTYLNYFFWCALQETLPQPVVPKHRLAVLIEPLEDFMKRAKEAGQAKVSTSGVTVRRENLVVLASSPNDVRFQKLKLKVDEARSHPHLRSIPSVDDLLTGAIWSKKEFQDPDPRLKTKTPLMEAAILQTLVVLLKQMEDDVEWMTISREGTRQLLGAGEFLSRNVTVPEWIQAGLVNYFEIAPAYRQRGYLYHAFGLPRGDFLRDLAAFKVPMKGGEPQYGEILTDLVTDKYFRPRNDLAMGQAASWGLIYFLASERKLDYVKKYAWKINDLPRHMVFQPDTLEKCFRQSFNMDDTRDTRRITAKEWMDHLGNLPGENQEVAEFFAQTRAPAAP